MISSVGAGVNAPTSQGVKSQKPDLEIKREVRDHADMYSTSRKIGDYFSGAAMGAVKEEAASAVLSPWLAAKVVQNCIKAETIGPNLKLIGSVLGPIPVAAASILAGPFVGAALGFSEVSSAIRKQDSPLVQDTSADVSANVYNFASKDGEPSTMTGDWVKSLDEFGNRKLAPGEKPYDVPVLSPAFAIVGGVGSASVAATVGLGAGIVAGGITTAKEMADAFHGDKTMGQRVGQFCAAPLNLVVMGPALAWNGFKESFPRGLTEGWEHGPIRPLVDTSVASVALAGAVIKQAWER